MKNLPLETKTLFRLIKSYLIPFFTFLFIAPVFLFTFKVLADTLTLKPLAEKKSISKGAANSETLAEGICKGEKSDLALVWAMDVSSSMDALEMSTQLQGYINALKDPKVVSNLLNCQCTEIALLLWAETTKVAFDFKKLDSIENIASLILVLENLKPQRSNLIESLGDQTMIDIGVLRASEMILSRKNQSLNHIISVSGDGFLSQLSPSILQDMNELKQSLHYEGITINGLPILVHESEDPVTNPPKLSNGYVDLEDFYKKEVVTPFGYVEKATGYTDFARAIQKSLLRDSCNVIM